MRRERLLAAICCLGLTAALFAGDPGRIDPDTKLDLSIDPARFLAAATRLWQPQIAFGELQNQAYGYLFPMGPFFLLGHAAGIPAWATGRLWQSALLVAALLGCRALARRLGIGTPATRVVGALAYALSPFVLSHLGPISSEAQPECLAPFVLLPLVAPEAPWRPRRAAAASGVALLLAGAVNASATIAVLVPPLLWFTLAGRNEVPQARSPAVQAGSHRRLLGWWVLAVVLATLWWAVPLVLLGRYSAPF
ncbi:MAG TPA: alpha-(1-_3)-arabinofuranosyltransferase family protein, partial [Acidimicrobiales bacterium]|nr:alpha-(1->3)-arabinofuranosyltransferase family protein [Acidimicrobiales bacterium]